MIRAFNNSDRDKLLALLKLNTPEYFHPDEAKDFEAYLSDEVEDYFVIEVDDTVVGCGGINYMPERKTARIAWDMIDPYWQGRGLGSKLVKMRIEIIEAHGIYEVIEVRTSQLAHSFYGRQGFELDYIVDDYWAAGYDLYAMVLRL